MHNVSVDYLEGALSNPKGVCESICRAIDASKVEFDSVVCRGISGLVVSPIVAMMLGKPLTIVRHSTKNSHSHNLVEGIVGGRYIIIDDLIDTGATIERIRKALINARVKEMRVCKASLPPVSIEGIFLYHNGGGWEGNTFPTGDRDIKIIYCEPPDTEYPFLTTQP